MSERATKRRKTSDKTSNDGPTITDPRFAKIQSDPRYRLPSKKTTVKVDKRFAGLIKDDDFSKRAKVDRYGRRVEGNSEVQRLKRRFEFEDEVDDDDEVQQELQRVEKSLDPLRESAPDAQSSSDDSSSSDEEEDEYGDEDASIDQAFIGKPSTSDVPMGEVSSRIAIVNLDWDNIRAQDLFAVFSSFLPEGGRLKRVSIYPSEFGKKRLEREEMEGPPKEIFARSRDKVDLEDGTSEEEEVDEDDEDIKQNIMKPDSGKEFNSDQLRQYQLQRLRYFYAVLEFSSASVAESIYQAVDGTEYLTTANFFDLRFVPDDTDFSEDKPRESCSKITDDYRPNEFVTDALQHSKVKLSWDAEDNSRKEAQKRAFGGSRKEIDENDLKAYLGSDSSDGESEIESEIIDSTINIEGEEIADPDTKLSKKEQERQRVRALLGLGAEPAKRSKPDHGPVGNIQVTFSSGLTTGNGEEKSVFQNDPFIEETTAEKYVRKEKERKQRRKEKMKGKMAEDDNDPPAEEKELGFDDPFFAEPNNDKISNNKIRKEERLKKKAERKSEEEAAAKQREELELLMVDDKNPNVRHFDIKEIERAEKKAKKGKKNKKANTEGARTVGDDDVKVDANDPRFARLYETHDFAIDPSNPKYKDTKNMKAIVEEGRKRKSKSRKDTKDELSSSKQES